MFTIDVAVHDDDDYLPPALFKDGGVSCSVLDPTIYAHLGD